MRTLMLLTALTLGTMFANHADSALVGPFEFSGIITFTNGDIANNFPGPFDVGSHFKGIIKYDDATSDINPLDPQVGFFLLSGADNKLAVTITDISGNDFLFEAVSPFVLIFDDAAPLGANRVDVGSDHFTAFSRNYLFRLGLEDFSNSIVSSDLLTDLSLTSSWDQILFELTTDRGIGDAGVMGFASLRALPVPEPQTSAMMLIGLGLIGLAARRRTGANSA